MYKRFIYIVFLAVITSCTANTGVESVTEVPDLDLPVVTFLSENASQLNGLVAQWGGDTKTAAPMVAAFYKNRAYRPVWTSEQKPSEHARVLDSLLHEAADYGLDTNLYHLDQMANIEKKVLSANDEEKLNAIASYEVLLTSQALRFMSHLNQGIMDPDSFWAVEPLANVNKDVLVLLEEGIKKNQLKKHILKAQPDFYEYQQLQQGLASFLDSFTLNRDTFFVHNPKKDSAEAMADAKVILIKGGFITEKAAKVDSNVVRALKKFQIMHGLDDDGKVGKNTRAVLVLNNHDRYMHAAVSLQRLRWEADTVLNYIYVNIPSYSLKAVENNEVRKQFKVVVGTPWTPTPTLTASMEKFIINPKWFVPYSISTAEIMPKAMKDSTYLARNGYAVYSGQTAVGSNVDWSKVSSGSYKIRQASGSGNALGKVKFIFPNPHNVYIHDTPSKSFFNREVRAYSHGCMRLQNPREFADYLSEFQSLTITPDSLDSLFAKRERKTVNLKENLTVKVRYVTTTGDVAGKITFFRDIYEKDAKMIKAWPRNQASDPSI